MTLQQNVLSKNYLCRSLVRTFVLTLQQNVLSKNAKSGGNAGNNVLTLQQNVLSKNTFCRKLAFRLRFDFTTKCSF